MSISGILIPYTWAGYQTKDNSPLAQLNSKKYILGVSRGFRKD